MATTKRIASISIVTDSETSCDKIGDVDGGFDDTALAEHIKNHGHTQLLEKLAYMQWRVIEAVREANQHRQEACVALAA